MYDKVLLRDILSDPELEIFDHDTGKIQPPSHEVFKVIAKCMQERGSIISSKHVYVIINEDRNGFQSELRKVRGVEIHVESSDSEVDETSEASNVDTEIFERQTFDIVLSENEWSSMKPQQRVYGKRSCWRLRSGWTDVIAKLLWLQAVSCVFTFKYNLVQIANESAFYAKFKGICVECAGVIIGVLLSKPVDGNEVVFKCELSNTNPQLHKGTRKRHLRGKRREDVTRKMITHNMDAVMFRRNEAKKMKRFGQDSPPIIPSSNVLRKAKEERVNKDLNLNYSNPSLNLLSHAKIGKFSGSIHALSLLKFYCIYWSKEQELIYRARSRWNRNSTMTIDATGGVVKTLDGDDPAVFLYQCMLVTAEGSVPVFQMISADQRALIIIHFLKIIVSKGLPPPRVVISDFGRAILLAVADVFSKCGTLNNYLQQCYNVVMNNGDDHIPHCFIRLDVSHVIRMVGRWKCLTNKVSPVKRFFLHCIGQAYQMCNMEDLQFFIESIFVVCVSQFIGITADGVKTNAQIRIEHINKIIQGTEEIQYEDENDERIEDELENDTSSTSWNMWADEVYKSAQVIADTSPRGTTINACFNPEFATSFKKQLVQYLPLWTGIMRKYFCPSPIIATSSSVEAEFKDLKCRSFKGQLPLRADKFVLQHLEHLDGKIKLSSNKNDVQSEIGELVDDRGYAHLNVSENWRGLIPGNTDETEKETNSRDQRKPARYMNKCLEWEYVKDLHVGKLPMFLNGLKCSAVTVGSEHINVTQTCAFDSTFQIILSGLACNNVYKEAMLSSSAATAELALMALEDRKLVNKHYAKRAEILINLNIFRDSLTSYEAGLKSLNAECNVSHLNEYLFENEPSIRKIFNCHCGVRTERKTVMMNANVDRLLDDGLKYVENSIKDALITVRTCPSCGNVKEEDVIYGSHIFIDLSVFTDENYVKDKRVVVPTLESIAPTIQLDGKTYILSGVVHWIAGHYTAYVKTGTYWHLYDDLKRKRQYVNGVTKIQPHLLVYVIHK